jgi:cation diffusion facilitator family transporter
MKSLSRSSCVALLSIVSNTTLIAFKVIAGLISGSVSIISEAIHSSTDLVASVITFFSVGRSSRPADKEHPYGHGKIENISGIAEGILIFIAAAFILNEAIRKIIEPTPIEQPWLAIGVMLFSALVNILVSKKLTIVAKEEDSMALEADSLHLKTDVYAALGVAVGIALTQITGFDILDPIVAILVALLIIKEAWVLCKKGADYLMDTKLSDDEEARIIEIIESHKGEFLDFHKLKTRKSGNMRHIDFHITVDPDLSVSKAHVIVGELKKELCDEFKVTRVSVHVDPGEPINDELSAT